MKNYIFFKKLIDFIIATIFLIFSWPLFIVIALMIKVSSKGPIFYCQDRMGREEKKITVYKFRTMQVNARNDSIEGRIPINNYITKVGKLLRGPRIDELPQLINILKGEMSFIGPRPNNIYEKELKLKEENPKRKEKFKVRPGVLSLERLVSVWPEVKNDILNKLSRTENIISLDPLVVSNKIEFELYYIRNISFYLDLVLLYYGIRLFFREVVGLFSKKEN